MYAGALLAGPPSGPRTELQGAEFSIAKKTDRPTTSLAAVADAGGTGPAAHRRKAPATRLEATRRPRTRRPAPDRGGDPSASASSRDTEGCTGWGGLRPGHGGRSLRHGAGGRPPWRDCS